MMKLMFQLFGFGNLEISKYFGEFQKYNYINEALDQKLMFQLLGFGNMEIST